jgi:hypothetical protein
MREILSNTAGVITTMEVDEITNKMVIKKHQDIEANIEMTNRLRNNDEYTRNGIKKGWLHAAHIPEVVIVELLQNGINVFHASAKEIVAGLKKIGKDNLLTTRARI